MLKLTTQAKQRRAYFSRSVTSVTCVILATLISAPTFSQDNSQQTSVEKCRLMPSTSTRLKCYDELFAVTPEPNIITTPSLPVVTTTPKVNQNTSQFKSTDAAVAPKPLLTDNNKLTQSVEDFRKSQTPETQRNVLQSLSFEILRTKEFGYEKTRFYMKNGQIWEQADNYRIRVPKTKQGKPNVAEIKKAALGSFLLRINGKGRAIRIRRVK